MAKQEMKYEEAVAQLEVIVRRMETGELNLDSLADELKKAQKLIKMCKDKLTKTDEEIKKMLEEEG
ncbi:exodeoxyribonuclease VII small subunit [Prevotella conceptionensis]|jgi:exonuclease VII small subunit|uniref:exodeoxyribonuclease VII small subunit n=1 Tax=Prevotella conceptionensis TaxID=340486 RepID=UPI00030F2AC7|nr:exodeoxyribonuclease VII small subunit [Prevotella conceptionensis]